MKLQNKTRCLFVSHAPLGSLGGGASNSLLIFLKHQDFLEVDLVLPLFIGRLFKLPKIIRQAYELKPPSVRKIYFLPLPWSSCFEGKQTSFKANSAYFVNNILAFLFLPAISLLLNKSEYKFFHFNSIVLHQLVRRNSNHILHVREIIDRDYPRRRNAINNLNKADGLIFIDNSSFQAYKQCGPAHNKLCHRVINNPFDMHEARDLRKDRKFISDELNLKNIPKKIFTYLGNLHPVKGTDLIIKAFIEANLKDAILLIVGTGNTRYLDYCRSLAKTMEDKILFLGMFEYKDVQKIYAVSDFVLRGDPDFRLGRTTYEALYAGSGVVLPGTEEDLSTEPDLQDFSASILFYKPGNVKSLAAAMEHANKSKSRNISNNTPTGNMTKHCLEMQEFISKCTK